MTDDEGILRRREACAYIETITNVITNRLVSNALMKFLFTLQEVSPVSDVDTLFFIRVAEHVCQNHAVLNQILDGEPFIPNEPIVSIPPHFLLEAEAHALLQSVDDPVTATLLAYAHECLSHIAQTDIPISPFDLYFFSHVMLRMMRNHRLLRVTLAGELFGFIANMFKAWDETEEEEKTASKNDPASSC